MSENTQKKARSIEMVTGSLWKNIILFSIPLMCSQLLEVLFNLSDVAVVGRFADYRHLVPWDLPLCSSHCLSDF